MRGLSPTLEAAQKATTVKALCKIVLTLSGEDTQTYTTTRILDSKDTEEGYRQTGVVLLDNADGALTALDLKGYKGVISHGATTSEGDEYDAIPPLWVVGQQMLSWRARQDRLACVLSLAGTFNLMATQGASAIYAPDSTDTDTVQTILTAIAEATLSCYSNYHAFTITFDGNDTLIDSFQPKDGFSIYLNESRLSAMKRLLRYTNSVMKVLTNGTISVFVPTTSSTSYDYEYELGAGNHAFFSMSNRKRLVIPYYVQVDSHPSHGDDYTGYAEDTDTATLVALDDTLAQREYIQLRLEDNTQAGNIATARLAHYQLDAEKGSANVPMNVGAEVYDYVNCIDSRDSDTNRTGNIGYLERHYAPGRFEMTFRFGSVAVGGGAGTMLPQLAEGGVDGLTLAQIMPILEYMMSLINQIIGYLEQIDPANPFKGFIWIDGSGNIHIRPKSGLDLISYEDLDPKTTNDASLGSSTKEWLEGHIKKAYHDTRLVIPVGPNMYD